MRVLKILDLCATVQLCSASQQVYEVENPVWFINQAELLCLRCALVVQGGNCGFNTDTSSEAGSVCTKSLPAQSSR